MKEVWVGEKEERREDGRREGGRRKGRTEERRKEQMNNRTKELRKEEKGESLHNFKLWSTSNEQTQLLLSFLQPRHHLSHASSPQAYFL